MTGKDYSRANRGMPFEEYILAACHYYWTVGIAAIVKIPTSFKVVRRYDPRTNRSEIVSAFPERKAHVDFIGQYYHVPIAFEAKSTENKTSFALSKIADHQLDHLRIVDSLCGAAFVLLYVEQRQAVYRITLQDIIRFTKSSKRKSIPFDWLEDHCYRCRMDDAGILLFLEDL